MSNIISPRKVDPKAAMVRGFRGEPKHLLVASLRGQLIEVTSLDKTARICVPAADVFAFDARLFRRLARAYRGGVEAQVTQMWTQATAYGG